MTAAAFMSSTLKIFLTALILAGSFKQTFRQMVVLYCKIAYIFFASLLSAIFESWALLLSLIARGVKKPWHWRAITPALIARKLECAQVLPFRQTWLLYCWQKRDSIRGMRSLAV